MNKVFLHTGMVIALLVLSTAKSTAEPTTRQIGVTDDVPYRAGSSIAWRLDVANPENFGGDRKPALVIIHGGGWNAGSKQDMPYRTMLMDYALRGYVAFSIDYRLTDEAPLPAAIDDVKCAVRWVRAHASDYGIDPDRIGVYGHSAGAHLSLMVGMSPAQVEPDDDCEWSEYPSQVASAAGGATPTDISNFVKGGDVMSPVRWIGPDVVPLLLIHGTEDDVVPVDGADRFVELLQNAGAQDITYVRVEGANHGVAFEHYMMQSKAALFDFFDRTLGVTSD